jgi:hypothetical protein
VASVSGVKLKESTNPSGTMRTDSRSSTQAAKNDTIHEITRNGTKGALLVRDISCDLVDRLTWKITSLKDEQIRVVWQSNS